MYVTYTFSDEVKLNKNKFKSNYREETFHSNLRWMSSCGRISVIRAGWYLERHLAYEFEIGVRQCSFQCSLQFLASTCDFAS